MIKIKEGFTGERVLSLPESLLAEYDKDALINSLYVRKIGFFPKVKYHYVSKEQGCDYSMIIYCVDGRGWVEINGRKVTIEKDQFIFLPYHTPYSFGANDLNPWSIYWIHFQGKSQKNYLPHSIRPITLEHDENSRNKDRNQMFEEIYVCFSMAYMEEYMRYTSICLSMYLASFIYPEQFRHIQVKHKTEYSFIEKVIHYMEEKIETNLTLHELAEHFKYSPSHFSMLFQRETKMTPINYFNYLKIQKACEHIELTNMKLYDISTKLGYKDPAYFNRVFTKIMGLSPSAYRDKNREINS